MIKNRDELLKGSEGRRLVLNALEYALASSDPRKIIHKSIRLENDTLIIKGESIKLDFRSIYVIGGGKASGYMAEAINSILDDRITKGFVIVPNLTRLNTGRITLWEADHPIPSKRGVEGVKKMLEIVSNASNDDLVLCLISGGGSSLMCLPYDGITLEEKQELTRRLLRSGASIEEINTVRKHVSAIKGGRLVEILRHTNIISLIISDVINDRLDTIASGLTVADETTFLDAKNILEKYNLFHEFRNVKMLIEDGINGKIRDTPKPNDPVFKNTKNIILANNQYACIEAMNFLANQGIDARILTTSLRGEARDVGLILASIANSIRRTKSIALVAGGETSVTVHGNGRGGRNQEMMLSALRLLKDEIVMASIATDGIDGNSDAAGAIIDHNSINNAKSKGLSIEEFLKNNDSNSFFMYIGDAIYTGYTGTNLNDITIILINKL